MEIQNRRLSLTLPRRKPSARLYFVAALAIVLAACTSSGGGDPAKMVERYLTAKVASDEQTLRGLLCGEMEADLPIEASSFAGLDAKIDSLSCQRQGDTDVVACTGKVVATYGTEDRDFPFTSYRVVQEDGEWKWCGEAP